MTEKVEEAKEPAIMSYNKDQERPYKNPIVQYYRETINDWQTTHIAHRWWSEIDVEDQLKLVQHKFRHLADKKRFRIIDEDGNIIVELNTQDESSRSDIIIRKYTDTDNNKK